MTSFWDLPNFTKCFHQFQRGRLLEIWSDRCFDCFHLWQHVFNILFMHLEIENCLSVRQLVIAQSIDVKCVDYSLRVTSCKIEDSFMTTSL